MLGLEEPEVATELHAPLEETTSDDAVGIKLYPPLSVPKTTALMIVTLSAYQIFWFYRTARDVREGFDISLKPWKWPFATLFGLVAAIAGRKLAGLLEDWAIEIEAPRAKFFDPVVIGISIFTLHLVAYSAERLSNGWLFLLGALGLSIPFLVMQHQLNLIKERYDPSSFRTPANRYTKKQIATVSVFGLVCALYVSFLAFDAWQRRSAEEVAVGDVLRDEQSGFQVNIQEEDWSRVDQGYLSPESAMEFLGPDEFTWVIVNSYPSMALDDIMDLRIELITQDFPGANCTQSKSLAEKSLVVVSFIYCDGSDIVNDKYVFVSRTLAGSTNAVEMMGFTTEWQEADFSAQVERLQNFVYGLELIP